MASITGPIAVYDTRGEDMGREAAYLAASHCLHSIRGPGDGHHKFHPKEDVPAVEGVSLDWWENLKGSPDAAAFWMSNLRLMGNAPISLFVERLTIFALAAGNSGYAFDEMAKKVLEASKPNGYMIDTERDAGLITELVGVALSGGDAKSKYTKIQIPFIPPPAAKSGDDEDDDDEEAVTLKTGGAGADISQAVKTGYEEPWAIKAKINEVLVVEGVAHTLKLSELIT